MKTVMTEDCIQRCEEFLRMLRNEKQPIKPKIPSSSCQQLNKTNLRSLPSNGIKSRIQRPCMQKINSPHKLEVRSRTKCNSNTWDGLLTKTTTPKNTERSTNSSVSQSHRNQSTNNEINFMQFDPVRTIEFLTLELQSRLKKSIPDDKSAHNVLSEIHQTIKRLSNTSTHNSSSHLLHGQDKQKLQKNQKNQTTENYDEELCSNEKLQIIPELTENICSTEELKKTILLNPLEQLFIPDNLSSVEETRKLKNAYENVKKEKELIRKDLEKSRIEIIFLTKENKLLEEKLKMKEILSSEKNSMKSLEEQYKRKQVEIKNAQDIIDYEGKQKHINELNIKLKNSFDKIAELENKHLDYDKNLIFTQMEKEKLKILLKSRENQIHDIQKELSDIQNLVHEQLDTIKNDMILEMPSNINNNISASSNDLNSRESNQKSSTIFSSKNKRSMYDHFPEKDDIQINKIEFKKKNERENYDSDAYQFDEFRKMIGDVTIPDPPRNFRSFSMQNVDNSFDASQIISLNE